MDKALAQFQADLLKSIREMNANQRAAVPFKLPRRQNTPQQRRPPR